LDHNEKYMKLLLQAASPTMNTNSWQVLFEQIKQFIPELLADELASPHAFVQLPFVSTVHDTLQSPKHTKNVSDYCRPNAIALTGAIFFFVASERMESKLRNAI